MTSAADELPPYMTITQVATLLQVTPHTVQRWVWAGQLEAGKAGHHWRITPAALEAFLATPSRHGLAWVKRQARRAAQGKASG